jgi:hypothetical protein
MNNILHPHKNYNLLLWLFACIILNACQQPKPPAVKPDPTFKKVWGVGFTEVRRCFNTGYSFSPIGYQQEPSWRLSFPSDDSVTIYNPKRKMFVTAPLMFDHDSVFNVAWSYLRLKKLTKDSIIFQVLKISGKVVENEKSIVFMTFYSNNYIKNVLHKEPLAMQVPNRADTLFIRKKTEQAKNDISKAFAARQPVQLKSKSPLVRVVQVINDDRSESATSDQSAIDYLSPEFNISIHKAYDDFNYSFTILVDDQGQMSFNRSRVELEPEFAESMPRVMKAIVNGYLKAYLQVKAGTTLGIPHASKIIVNVTGTKS